MIFLIVAFDLVHVVYVFVTVAGLNAEAIGSLPGEIYISSVYLFGGVAFDNSFLAVVVKTQDQVWGEVLY